MPSHQLSARRGRDFVFLIREPSGARISRLFDEQRDAPFSYAEVGSSRETPAEVPGYTVDHNRIRLGEGEEAFGRAVEALFAWKMFDVGWVRILPQNAPVEAGATVGVLARHYGFRSLNLCRVVYEIDDYGPVHRRGFAYGTLSEHGARGEERFTVDWHQEDDSIFYGLYAFSRPNHPLPRLGRPFARSLQQRFTQDSLRAMFLATSPKPDA